MYQYYRRNKYDTRPYGYSWPYYGQPTYQLYNGGGYQANWNQYNPYSYMEYNMNSYPGNNPYGYPPPISTPYPTGMEQGVDPMKQKGAGGILNQFKKKDGTYDINKMMDTAGQMVGAVNQVNSIVKGLTKTFKV
ncbi:YppG family protein [Bacillus timonensis]|uniref:YppG family protein n=1 Tax=Bacillus timonensis TaxID=1033734 RepID=UPI000289F6CC|nr:YppG family protein [Bacillus timonensis]